MEQVKKVNQPFLKKEVNGIPLAFRKGSQMERSVLLHRHVELNVKVKREDTQGNEIGENKTYQEAPSEVPKVVLPSLLPRTVVLRRSGLFPGGVGPALPDFLRLFHEKMSIPQALTPFAPARFYSTIRQTR